MTKAEFARRGREVFGAYGWMVCVSRGAGVDYSSVKRWLSGSSKVPWYASMIVELAERVPQEKWPRDLFPAKRMPAAQAAALEPLAKWGEQSRYVPKYLVTILMLIESIPNERLPWAP